jgi:hypothetical protein
MNRRVLGLVAVLSLAPFSVPAADDDGFRPLFNGKDLAGWITPDDASIFFVENGEIIGRTEAGQLKKNEFLVTDQPYGDFVLKAIVKLRDGNSGIQIRSERAPNGAVKGPQADIADSYWGSLYYEGTGRLFRYPQEYAKDLVKVGDWNELIITAKGKRILTTLNGRTVFDCTDPQFEATGIIALQVHAGPPMEVRYKDVQIKTSN